MFDDYSTETCEDLFIFNSDLVPWSLHYFPCSSENLIPLQHIFPLDKNTDWTDENPVNTPKKKKDRHSKIETAGGLRERRMRLSREVARQLFDLQDMLGVDKASEAIQWLLAQASSKIKALSNYADNRTGMKRGSILLEDKKIQKHSRKDVLTVRESRKKARARAKQRTREKMILKQLQG